MSNFLNHLVTRSLNPMEMSVQPRLPSLFEPVAGVPALGTVPEGLGEPEVRSAIEAPQFRKVPSPQVPTHTGDIQSADRRSPPPASSAQHPLQPRPTTDVSELRFVPPTQASSEPLPVAPQSPISHPRQDRPFSVAQAFEPPKQDRFQSANQVQKTDRSIDAAEQKPAIVQQTVIQRVVEQLFSSQAGDVVDSSKVSAKATVSQEDRPTAIAPNLPTASESPTPTSMPVWHSPSAIVQPQITPAIQPIKATAIVSAEPPQPTPTIQVTIGRIEVRAMPAPAPAATQARPKSPVMSLEEYLHRRGGGR